jgi:hypothetical protein
MGEKPFRLDFRDEGVFLLVDSGVNVPVSDVLDYLHAMEIEEYDASAVTKAVEEPGDFVRVADRKQELLWGERRGLGKNSQGAPRQEVD